MDHLLTQLTELKGIPAHEKSVRDFIAAYVKKEGRITYDNLGSIIVEKRGQVDAPRIMLAAHMDEIGFIVSEITNDGFIKFIPAGGWWSHVVLGQQFVITTSAGKEIRAVVGSKPPHILSDDDKKKVVELTDMFMDIGVRDKEDAEATGIKTGDMITPFGSLIQMANANYLMAKAFDDRIGVYIMLKVLDALENQPHPNTLFAVGTIQEEVGLRGAGTSSHRVQPDIGISIDVTVANDYPGGAKNAVLGKGPCLMIYDSSMVGHPGLRAHIEKMCVAHEIPYQLSYILRGGTDAGKIHLSHSGCPSIALTIPTRYIHSHSSIIHMDDVNHSIRLITELIQSLDATCVRKITED